MVRERVNIWPIITLIESFRQNFVIFCFVASVLHHGTNCCRHWKEYIILYVFVKKRAAFVCFCQKESGPRVVKSGHGPDRSLARARARPPMRAVPRCRTRVSSRRSSGYQESQWILRGLSALLKQPRPPLRCDKRQGHRETKRAPSGKWNGRRVENDGNFGAQ